MKQPGAKLLSGLLILAALLLITLRLPRMESAPGPTELPAATQAAEVPTPAASPDYAGDYSYTDGTGRLDEYGTYASTEDVAYYIHLYGHLPDNYITKAEAEEAGWDAGQGNLWEVAEGMSIGGDPFGNREGLLPAGETYYECDVNYSGGYRGDDRIVFSEDGDVYYTADHYESFTRLY